MQFGPVISIIDPGLTIKWSNDSFYNNVTSNIYGFWDKNILCFAYFPITHVRLLNYDTYKCMSFIFGYSHSAKLNNVCRNARRVHAVLKYHIKSQKYEIIWRYILAKEWNNVSPTRCTEEWLYNIDIILFWY